MPSAYDFAATDAASTVVNYIVGTQVFDARSDRAMGSISHTASSDRCWIDVGVHQIEVWVVGGKALVQESGYGTFGFVSSDGSVNRQGASSGRPLGRIGVVIAGPSTQRQWQSGAPPVDLMLLAGCVAAPMLVVAAGGEI